MNFNISELFSFIAFNSFWDYLQITFLGAFIIQLLFYAGIFSRLAFFKKKKDDGLSKEPVSVIICAKNERDNLYIANTICSILDKKWDTAFSHHDLKIFVEDRLGHDFRYSINSELIKNAE